MTASNEPMEYYERLNFEQRHEVDQWNNRRTVLLQDRVQQEMSAKLEEYEDINQVSTPLLKVVVTDPNGCEIQQRNDYEVSSSTNGSAVITFWNPSQDQIEVLREGSVVSVRNLNVRKGRFDGMLQLSANDRTIIRTVLENKPFNDMQLQLPSDKNESKDNDTLSSLFEIQLQVKKMTNTATDNALSIRYVNFVGIVLTCKLHHQCDDLDMYQVFVTDESGLVLQINIPPIPNRQSLVSNLIPSCTESDLSFVVLRFSNVQVPIQQQHETESMSNYTTLIYNSESSFDVNDQSRRRLILDGYVSSIQGHQNIYNMKLYVESQIPVWFHYNDMSFGNHDYHHEQQKQQQGQRNIIAFGYAIQIESILSISSLVLTVDCGDDRNHIWILPLSLLPDLHKTINTISLDKTYNDRLVLPQNVSNELIQLNSGIGTIIKELRQIQFLYHLTLLNHHNVLPI
jgi:hypothetical protein